MGRLGSAYTLQNGQWEKERRRGRAGSWCACACAAVDGGVASCVEIRKLWTGAWRLPSFLLLALLVSCFKPRRRCVAGVSPSFYFYFSFLFFFYLI